MRLHHATIASWAGHEQRANTTWQARCPETVSDLMVRVTNNVYDYSRRYDDITRYAREYYWGPRRDRWMWASGLIDLAAGQASHIEHGWRSYLRVYHGDDAVDVDAPMLSIGGLPQSWMPAGVPRSAETITWETLPAVDLIDLSITWLPTCTFACLDATMELLRLSVDADNYLVLRAVIDDRWERVYNRGDVYGPHEPRLELALIQSGSETASCSCAVYWGLPYGSAAERWDDPLQIRIRHDARHGIILNVRRACRTGTDLALVSGGLSGSASLVVTGHGWWTAPTVTPAPRHGLWLRGLQADRYGACLSGDLDPVRGAVDTTNPFDRVETFQRADDPNLGSAWDIILQTGNGWDISGNRAKGTSASVERWEAEPNLRDCSLHAEIQIDDVGSALGLIRDMDWLDADYDRLYGYEARVTQSGASTITLEILSLYHDGAANDEETLATDTGSADPGDALLLVFDRQAEHLTATVYDAADQVLVQVQVDDWLHYRPGAVGIRCATAGSSAPVWISRIWAETERKRRL
jgi:hypothetical protein